MPIEYVVTMGGDDPFNAQMTLHYCSAEEDAWTYVDRDDPAGVSLQVWRTDGAGDATQIKRTD